MIFLDFKNNDFSYQQFTINIYQKQHNFVRALNAHIVLVRQNIKFFRIYNIYFRGHNTIRRLSPSNCKGDKSWKQKHLFSILGFLIASRIIMQEFKEYSVKELFDLELRKTNIYLFINRHFLLFFLIFTKANFSTQ